MEKKFHLREACCEQHYNKYYTRQTQHVSKLPVWCHPCVHKTRQINVSQNGTINTLFLAKYPLQPPSQEL